MPTPLQLRFGKALKRIRLQRHLSQEALGDLANLSTNSIGSIERAQSDITLTSMERLAKALRVPISRLFRGI